MLNIASSAGLLVVLVSVKANFAEVSILMTVCMTFAGFMFDSSYGVGLYCCSCRFLGHVVV